MLNLIYITVICLLVVVFFIFHKLRVVSHQKKTNHIINLSKQTIDKLNNRLMESQPKIYSTCPCSDEHIQAIRINIKDNEQKYQCEKCNKQCKLIFNIESVLANTPVNAETPYMFVRDTLSKLTNNK